MRYEIFFMRMKCEQKLLPRHDALKGKHTQVSPGGVTVPVAGTIQLQLSWCKYTVSVSVLM